MKYYLLDTLSQTDETYCFIDVTPIEIRAVDYKIRRGLSILSEYPQDASVPMSNRFGGMALSDLLPTTDSMIIASAKMKSVIEPFMTYPTEYLPLTIINHKNRIASREYFYINPMDAFECLSYSRSKINWFKGEIGGRVIRIADYVLSAKKLESQLHHLFRIKEEPHTYVISELLLNAFTEAGLTNINVKELTVEDDQ